jgi:potassium channel subfamily K
MPLSLHGSTSDGSRYLSSFTLIGLCACASGPLVIEPKSDHAFTQAYYYAIFSAGLYLIVATLMLVTAWGAIRGHYDKEFQLTMSQRTLMLQTISFLIYLLAGAAVYSHIEGWAFLDAVYWADFTLLTVGTGDYAPQTHLGRSLLFPFAIGGIIILGLVIGSIRSLVLERGKVKMGARMVEKERRRLLKKLRKQDAQLLEPVTDGTRPISRSSSKTLQNITEEGFSERERRRKEFNLMRKIQEGAAIRRRWTSLAISATVWFGLWFIGAAIFEAAEYGQKWSYFVSLYFSYTSLLTIGYGDVYPQSNSGKAFFVFWSLLAVPSLTILISNMGDTIVKGIADLTLRIGNFTVLPDEKGVKANLKETIDKFTGGRLFTESAPGLLGESNKKKEESSEDDQRVGHKNDPESAAQEAAGDRAVGETARAKKQGEGNDELPKSKHHYHLVLAKEIGKVMKHLNSSPPRKYTFDEWAWYLKLIGEDESSAETHRKAKGKPRPDGEGLGAALDGKDADLVEPGFQAKKWSWVGNRSPLMGNKEEAEVS